MGKIFDGTLGVCFMYSSNSNGGFLIQLYIAHEDVAEVYVTCKVHKKKYIKGKIRWRQGD